jgi:hypothetical protein
MRSFHASGASRNCTCCIRETGPEPETETIFGSPSRVAGTTTTGDD